MHIGKANELSRRAFLRRSGQLAGAGAASTYALGLAGLGEAAAFSNAGGYKALVCVFLYGGNDHANTLIPYDQANHAMYNSIRGGVEAGVAISRSDLSATRLITPVDQKLTDDLQYALAPSMPRMKARFDQRILAPLLNVGPLEAPITKAQYESENDVAYPRPARLFSHNDQQSTWQSSQPEGAVDGWGGRLADLAQSGNANAMFTSINAAGGGVFLQGKNSTPFRVSRFGAHEFRGVRNKSIFGSGAAGDALKTILTTDSSHILASDYARMNKRSIEYGSFINRELPKVNLNVDFGSNNALADQLSVVARLIAIRQHLGVARQVFFVGMPGFDHHSGLIGRHQNLLGQLDMALDAFFRATVELGIEQQVTLFTASDFGRTLTNNGDGSDHGWGGHHFILGGAVNGGRFYGHAPHTSVTSEDQVGRGRLLPSTSVDEYSATLARWFGVAASELSNVIPNIGRFASSSLGFMKLDEP